MDYIAKYILVGMHGIASVLGHEVVVCLGRFHEFGCYGITLGEVENNDIASFDLSETFQASILPRWPFGVALCVDYRHAVLYQREVYRSHRYSGSVGHLVDPQVVAYE